jgi:hypothetical protein
MRLTPIFVVIAILASVAATSAQAPERKFETYATLGFGSLKNNRQRDAGSGVSVGVGMGTRPLSNLGLEIDVNKIWNFGKDGERAVRLISRRLRSVPMVAQHSRKV